MSSLRLYIILGVVAVLVISLTVYGVYLYHAGESAAAGKQAVAQIKHDKKVRNDYDKIDKQTPYGGDNAAVAAFLLSHTGG